MTDTATAGRPRPTGRIVLATGVLPAVIGVVGALTVLSWRDDLPNRVATHWGTGGADGFSSVTGVALTLIGFCVVFAILGLALCAAGRTEPTIVRTAAGTASGTAGFVTALMVGLVGHQRGLADAADATITPWAIVGGIAVAALAAVVAVVVIPRWRRPAPAPAGSAPHLTIDGSELVSWNRSVAAGSATLAGLVIAVAVTAMAAFVSRQWWLLIITIVLALLTSFMFSIRVTVDRHGVTVAGRWGWPRFRTPLEEITSAQVAEIHPLRHFGGYGYRIAAFGPYRGASAYVLRGGPAIVLDRTSGQRTVIVVDDAATAAGLVNALIERRRDE
ncbi:DUF1648 domain-containing protein [Phytoactinopolyspora limicola]|uniref:DUF1648 domain-containing protein n=1 Tax=Phytoactinopolyspora limicola TaxID=2715536 RepID=UPI00140D7C11|nr:DUF1648 domain-containing protein [Phytoactinopolyspora limicola]